MKILLIKSYPHLSFLVPLAKGLSEAGHEVHLIVPSRHPDQEALAVAGIRIHFLDLWISGLRPGSIWKAATVLMRLIALMRSERYDVVNPHLHHSRFFARCASFFCKRTVVVSTIQGCEAIFERATGWIDGATICVSQGVRSFLIESGMPPDRLIVIPNCFCTDEADAIPEDKEYLHRELRVGQETKLIGMVAYFYDTKSKGHTTFLDAARLLSEKRTDLRFVIVGDDFKLAGAREYFEAYARSIGIDGRVSFLGMRRDVLRIMGSLYAHVLPSLSEGCPTVLLEAMAKRVPNVASCIKSIEEVIVDRKTGLLFETGSAEGLARSLLFLLDRPGEAERMGRAGRARLEEVFGVQRIVKEYEALFGKLAAEKRGGFS